MMKKLLCIFLALSTSFALFAQANAQTAKKEPQKPKAAQKAQPSRYGIDWPNFGRYHNANLQVKERPVAVFMGDSITDGWARSDPKFFSDNNYIGRGISGQTTMQMLVRFRRDVVDLKPAVVVILAGTNDLALNNGFIAKENIVGNLISMCEIAKANNVKVILCSITPVSEYKWRKEVKNPAELVRQTNAMIKHYAEKNNIKYLDYHSALADELGGLAVPKHSHDMVHPNMDCYKIMEKMVKQAINEVVSK